MGSLTVLRLKPLWDNGRCMLLASFRSATPSQMDEINQLADEAGFVRSDDIWSLPDRGGGYEKLHASLRGAGYAVEYEREPDDAPFNLQRLSLQRRTRWRLEDLSDFRLDDLSGWTPVQAEGRLDGRYFYFRARGLYWRFELGGNRTRTRSPRWWYEESWPGSTGFEAGYMTDEEAVSCILKAIDQWREGDQSHFNPADPRYEHTVLDGWSLGALSLRNAAIRLGTSGEEVIRRTETHEIELPYTASLELAALNRSGTPIRHMKARKRKGEASEQDEPH